MGKWSTSHYRPPRINRAQLSRWLEICLAANIPTWGDSLDDPGEGHTVHMEPADLAPFDKH